MIIFIINNKTDIINVCYVITSLYKTANTNNLLNNDINKEDEDKIKYLPLKFLENKSWDEFKEFIPNFSLEKVKFNIIKNYHFFFKYRKMKEEILKAEQNLLRIINYNLIYSFDLHYIKLLYFLKQLNSKIDLLGKIYINFFYLVKNFTSKICFSIFNDTKYLSCYDKFSNLEIIIGSIFLSIQIYNKYYNNDIIVYKDEFWKENFKIDYKICEGNKFL